MYNDLQDALGYRADQNAPFNPTYTIAAGIIANLNLPINPAAAPPRTPCWFPAALQPDMYTPTVITYSLRIEQELSPNTSLSVGYVGSHGYHELIGVDANAPVPVVCPASPCPATFPNTADLGRPGRHAGAGRNFLYRAGHDETEHHTREHLDVVFRRHQFLQRAASGPETAVQPWAYAARRVHMVESLDDGDSLNATAAANAVPCSRTRMCPTRTGDWRPTTFETSASSPRPMICRSATAGSYLSEPRGAWDNLVGGWTVNSIVTAQSGFPVHSAA